MRPYSILFLFCFSCSSIRASTSSQSSAMETDESSETLASLAAKHGIRFGTYFVRPSQEPEFKKTVGEFNLYTLPVLFNLVWKEKNWPEEHGGSLNFAFPDEVAASAPPDTAFMVFSPIWCEQLPEWLKNGNYSAEEIETYLDRYLSITIDHYQKKYPGRVIAWEIVNEPTSYPPQSKKCVWHKIGHADQAQDGYRYIRTAFQKARALLPEGKLYINNFGTEDMGPKSQVMYDLVAGLVKQGVPIDGVGLESHFMLQKGGPFPQVPRIEDLVENLNRLGALGLKTMITEADIAILDSDSSPSALQGQAVAFRTLLRSCLQAKSCEAFTAFGVSDKDSWIPKDFPDGKGWGRPLLFDENYKKKPAYEACRNTLDQG